MPEYTVATAAVVTALAAACALVVSIIRSRKSLYEFFAEQDQPMPRGYRWFTRTALVLLGLFYGAFFCARCTAAPENALTPEAPRPAAARLDAQQPTSPGVGARELYH